MTKSMETSKHKKLPNNIGKTRRNTAIDGTKREIVIEDEILHRQHDAQNKLITFQRVRIKEEDRKERIEYRFGYYIIGVKPGAKGKWVWGQRSLMIPKKDLKAIIKKAETKGWL